MGGVGTSDGHPLRRLSLVSAQRGEAAEVVGARAERGAGLLRDAAVGAQLAQE